MSQIKLTADSGGGTTSLKAPSSTTSNADVVLKLPVADGSSGQVLKTDGSGQLSFTSNAGTTINNNADNRIITGSGTASTLNGESSLTWTGSALELTAGTGNQFPIQIRNDFTPNSQRADYASLLNATSNNTLRLGSVNSNGGVTIQATRGNDSAVKHDLWLQPDGGKVTIGASPIYNFNVRGTGQQTILVGSTDAGGAWLTLDGDSNGDGQSGDYCAIGHTTAGNLEIIADNPNGNANVIFKAGNAAEAFRIDSAGRLKINHSDHQSQLDNTFISVYDSNGGGGISKNYAMMQVNNYGTGNNGDTAGIGFGAGAGNSYIKGSIGFMRTGGYGQGDFTFNLNTDNSNALVNDTDEVVRIRKEGGITFNGDTAAANALDDFEEGSWTATVYWSSSNTTGGYTNTTTVSGNYTKIGGVVAVTVSVNPSTMNSGSNCWISYISLPFQPSSSWAAAFAPYSGRGNYGGTLDRDDYNVPYAQFSSSNGGTIVPLVTGMGRGAGYWGHYSGDTLASATISGTYMTNS